MTIHAPLQRKDGRWDYTSRTGSSGPHAIGYCFNGDKPFYSLEWSDLSDVVRGLYGNDPERWAAEKEKHAPRLHNYHNTGHETALEAIRCYRRYEVLEHTQRTDDASSQERCVVCNGWTQHRVLVGQGFHKQYAICSACESETNLLNVHLAGSEK